MREEVRRGKKRTKRSEVRGGSERFIAVEAKGEEDEGSREGKTGAGADCLL